MGTSQVCRGLESEESQVEDLDERFFSTRDAEPFLERKAKGKSVLETGMSEPIGRLPHARKVRPNGGCKVNAERFRENENNIYLLKNLRRKEEDGH